MVQDSPKQTLGGVAPRALSGMPHPSCGASVALLSKCLYH